MGVRELIDKLRGLGKEDEEEEPEVKSDELAPEIIKYIKDVGKAIEEATKLEE